jgi:leucyl/phenylalanyl-tRNA---protein transferase
LRDIICLMPFLLTDELSFPSPDLADEDGLLAVEGDLSPERLCLAYANGIFPWYEEGSPILWWSPDPRFILFPEKYKSTKSLRACVKKGQYSLKTDTAFRQVITACSMVPREDQDGTWITNEMIEAYCRLHELGIAHSFETYFEGRLVGGLYGVSLGACFMGESMFHFKTDASKFAFYHLVEWCKIKDFKFIDAQVETAHLIRMGAQNIAREDFLKLLDRALEVPSIIGKWQL